MTQQQKQSFIDDTAAKCNALADIYEAEEPSEEAFYDLWRSLYAAHGHAVTLCPPCSPTDPGPPPPPK